MPATPSPSSRQALAEIEAGEVERFATVDALMADLHAQSDDDYLRRKVDAGRASMAAGRGRPNEEVEATFAAKRAATNTTGHK